MKLTCKDHARRVMVLNPSGTALHWQDGTECRTARVAIGGRTFGTLEVFESFYATRAFVKNYRRGHPAS